MWPSRIAEYFSEFPHFVHIFWNFKNFTFSHLFSFFLSRFWKNDRSFPNACRYSLHFNPVCHGSNHDKWAYPAERVKLATSIPFENRTPCRTHPSERWCRTLGSAFLKKRLSCQDKNCFMTKKKTKIADCRWNSRSTGPPLWFSHARAACSPRATVPNYFLTKRFRTHNSFVTVTDLGNKKLKLQIRNLINHV